jgi:hypothetical protein
MNPGASFSPVFAAIWCGWTSGIFPSGQMYSRSHGFADGVNGPNESAGIFATAAAETNNVNMSLRKFSFLSLEPSD